MVERPEGDKEFVAQALPWVRRAFTIGIVAFILWRLTQFGWAELLANLPQNPIFYIVQIIAYSVLPISEVGLPKSTLRSAARRSKVLKSCWCWS